MTTARRPDRAPEHESDRRAVGPPASATDAPVIQSLITSAWMCAECLAEHAGLSRIAVYETLNGIAATTGNFRTDVRRCDRCLLEKVVHRIG
jgi:hypothetical protein